VSGGTACLLRGIRPLDCLGWPPSYASGPNSLAGPLASAGIIRSVYARRQPYPAIGAEAAAVRPAMKPKVPPPEPPRVFGMWYDPGSR
jgi:hypothetical protein